MQKLVVTALGAFGLGALVGWAITADIQQKQFAEERAGYDELLADKSDHVFALKGQLARARQAKADVVEVRSEDSDDPISIITDAVDEFVANEVPDDEEVEVPQGETPEVTRTNLQALIDSYTADPVVQAEFADIASDAAEYDKAPPFVISRGDFAYDEEGEHYAKITLTYYMRDRVLLDDEEDPIDDIPGMVGWRNLSQFGGESEDPDVVFVRNRRLQTDFEVVKEDGELPLHVKYGMEKEEFRVNKAAGLIKLRREDE